jgi:site-specific DNA-methyltransferase (adenine-specific)
VSKKKYTKSKARVKDFGEVFTNAREVNNMLSLIDESSPNKDLTLRKETIILEPTCGDGNFIVEIVKRKLEFNRGKNEEVLKEAISTIYGTDIQEDNVEETKQRVREMVSFDIEEILETNYFVSNFLEDDISDRLAKIDVIIGNPPYQQTDNGHGASAKPIYNLFIDKIRNEIQPGYFSFIVPSRWMTGGKGLKSFRESMLSDRRISEIVDYKNEKDCFPSVSIEGGVCYFLWQLNYEGDCNYKLMDNETLISEKTRELNEYDIFIRDNSAITILEKITNKLKEKNGIYLSPSIVRPPFGFNTNFKDYEEVSDKVNYIKLYGNRQNMKTTKGIGYVSESQIAPKGLVLVDKYKVLIPKARGGISKDKQIVGMPIITEKGSACSQTYVVIGSFDKESEAKKLEKYVRTKFFRYMVSLRKNTQDISIGTYSFVPDLTNYNFEPKDEDIYKYFNLTKAEISIVEKRINVIIIEREQEQRKNKRN